MGSHAEEQADEIEALQSIFTEGEFEPISETEFKLKLRPLDAGEAGENHVGVTLRVAYTPDYPETAPEWELASIVGLGDDKQEDLRNTISESVESSLGMVMIYTVAEAAREWLRANNVKALSMHEEMMKRLQGGEGDAANEDEDGEEDEDDDDDDDDDGDEEEEVWKGLADKVLVPLDQRLTSESFATWRQKFEEEMFSTGEWKREEAKGKTGKLIFMEAKENELGEGTTPTEGGKQQGLAYNAALFGEEDEDDLEDLSEGED
mmetsp:Transcript_25689/g.59375  ORF Transcript_25689/g.59375 Transcript_25689/m.59375 type:complete len:263 (-) Transcript_25689:95-883(-)